MNALPILGQCPQIFSVTALAAITSILAATNVVDSAEVFRENAQTKGTDSRREKMLFYLAKGLTDACGPGCSRWIAAEGRIDRDAARRLRSLLRKLPNRNLPIYFMSRGGSIKGAMALGRLMHRHRLKASVARTLPIECDDATAADKSSCNKLKRSGKPLMARFRTSGAYCKSACVYALVGAPKREVGSNVVLGVHAYRTYLNRPPRNPRRARLAHARVNRSLRRQLLEYLREVGMSSELFRIASRTKYSSMHILTLEEIDRLQIVKIPPAELARYLASKSLKSQPSMAGIAPVRSLPNTTLPKWRFQTFRSSPAVVSIDITGDKGAPQSVSLRIICKGSGMTRVTLRRDRNPDDKGIALPIVLKSRRDMFVFAPSDREAPIRDGRRLDERVALVPAKFFKSPPGESLKLTEVPADDPSKEKSENEAVAAINIPTDDLAESLSALQRRCRDLPPLGFDSSDLSGLPSR